MKKIMIIYPPITKQERYASDLGAAGGEQIPLGIYYLASVLRNNDYDVLPIDAEANRIFTEQLIEKINEYKPDFIGISSTTVAFHRAVDLAEYIKKQNQKAIIILGGPHVTSNPKHAMSYRQFDYGILKEGEITIIELLNALSAGEPTKDIKGITYVNEKDELIITEEREYIMDLDTIPFPAYDLIGDISLYTPPPSSYKTLPVINMITSRGCPSQCTFCDRNVFGQKYRVRSAENVFEEIKYLYNHYGIREIQFVDDTFLLNKKRVYELFDLLNKEGIKLTWTCGSRINNVDYDFLKFLKENGCWNISFGIESGDEEILKIMRKNIELDKVKTVLAWCKSLGIKTKGFFMIGHLGETIDTINKTIKFACSLPIDDVVATINTPIPGSDQFSMIDQYGNMKETDWSQFNYWRPVFVPNGLTQEILIKKHKEFYRKFYLKPRVILRYAKSIFGRGGLKRLKTLTEASLFLVKKSK